MAKIQIHEDTFYDLIRYHIYGDQDPDLKERITAALEAKVEAMARRQTYTDKIFPDKETRP